MLCGWENWGVAKVGNIPKIQSCHQGQDLNPWAGHQCPHPEPLSVCAAHLVGAQKIFVEWTNEWLSKDKWWSQFLFGTSINNAIICTSHRHYMCMKMSKSLLQTSISILHVWTSFCLILLMDSFPFLFSLLPFRYCCFLWMSVLLWNPACHLTVWAQCGNLTASR